MTTIPSITDDYFDGHSNLTQGQKSKTNSLADIVQAVRADVVTLEASDVTLGGRITTLEAAGAALDVKQSCRVATDTLLPAHTAAGAKATKTLTANAVGALTIDGVAVALNDRVLVQNDGTNTAADRGIYTVTTLGTGAVRWVLTRASDANVNTEVTSGMFCRVTEGTLYGDTGWVLATNDPIDLDVSGLSFNPWDQYAIAATIADVTKAAAAAGTSLTVARGDHKHDISTAAGGAVAPGDTGAEGTATSLARSDHLHTITCAAGGAVAPGDVAAEGAAVTFARSDHTHGITCAAGGAVAPGDVAAEGAAVTFARSDHVHNITCAAGGAVAPGDVAAEGAAVTFARSDHVHNITCAAGVDVAGDNAEGAAVTFARSDHTHKLADLVRFRPQDGVAPVFGNAAAAAVRNGRNVVAFDDGGGVADETWNFEGVMPPHLSATANIVVRILFAMDADNNPAHTLVWHASFERVEEGALDLDADGFAAAQASAAIACPNVAGYVTHADITFTVAQADGLLAGEGFRLNVQRNTTAGGGSTGDAHLVGVRLLQ